MLVRRWRRVVCLCVIHGPHPTAGRALELLLVRCHVFISCFWSSVVVIHGPVRESKRQTTIRSEGQRGEKEAKVHQFRPATKAERAPLLFRDEFVGANSSFESAKREVDFRLRLVGSIGRSNQSEVAHETVKEKRKHQEAALCLCPFGHFSLGTLAPLPLNFIPLLRAVNL